MNPNKSRGHAPYTALYLCNAEAEPGQIILWINGEAVRVVEDTTEGGTVRMSEEIELSEGDAIEFEAIPGRLLNDQADPLRRL